MSDTESSVLEKKSPPVGRSGHSSGEESMVVRLSRLDKMLELAGEVIIVSSNLSALSHQIQPGVQVSDHLVEDAKDLAITSSRISSDLHNLVTDVRTVDMSDLFARFRRLARDTSRRLGKAVRFEVEGEEVTIDKKISEKIYDPVAHQIRNAIAHGIEDEETRKRAGKDAVGTVRVSVRNLENNTVIEVVDDGAGIDDEAVRRRIAENGLLDEKAAMVLQGDALYEYLFLPGFSTATYTSGTAGRGVGMDVVRSVMAEVNGETRIQTEKGKGSTFSFILPLVTAVNISDSLLVIAGSTTFAFPISSVVASMSVHVKDVTTTTGKGRSIQYLGRILPLFDLLAVFGEQPLDPNDEELRVIIIEHKKRRVAYRVSDFMSPQKIVISEFDEGLRVPGLTGTATLSGRKLGMVVDLPELFAQTIGVDEERLVRNGVQEIVAEEPADEPATAPSPASGEASLDAEAPGPDSVFLTEVGNMLKQLNHELLALEESKDRETADAIFRQMHSIKGNLTMYGADEPASVTHQLETLLERARRGELDLDENVFDALYDGTAYLEEVVDALSEGRQAIAPEKLLGELRTFRERFERQAAATVASVDVDVDQVQLDPTGEFYLSSRRRDGATVYQARIDFDPGDQPRFLVAYLILRRIQRVADVLGTLPHMAEIEAGLCDGGIVVLFSPRENADGLLDKLNASLRRYYGVTRFEAAQYA